VGNLLERKGKERKAQGFNVQLIRSRLSHESNKRRWKEKNKTKKRWAIKSGNGYKNENPWDPSEKVRETMVRRTYEKGKFWVWNGTEMEWCIVKESGDYWLCWWWWWWTGERKTRWQWQGLIIDRLANFFRKFIPETTWGMAERVVVDCQRGIWRWTSKGDSISKTIAAVWLSLRDKIIEIKRFGSSNDFVSKRKNLIVYSFFNFEPV